jgi:hypothetical protein
MKNRRTTDCAMTDKHQQDAQLRATLNGETARFQWKELQRFFAAGLVIAVADELDLVEVALRVASDDKNAIAQWMDEGRIGKASDAQAQAWLEQDAALWTVVVKPWILVQREKSV